MVEIMDQDEERDCLIGEKESLIESLGRRVRLYLDFIHRGVTELARKGILYRRVIQQD